MDVVAVDWSGAAQGSQAHIWSAHVVDGALVALSNGRSRHEVVEDLVNLRVHSPGGLLVGLDFSFSFPSWFVRQLECATVDELWLKVAHAGEGCLADPAPPFWGRPGSRRPTLPAHLRRAEQRITVGGIRPKSVFQIGGAGAVGTGSLRGMPHLRRLRQAGFGIWPFDPASRWTVMEIYPRLLTGPVRKSDPEQRALYVGAFRDAPRPIAPRFARSMVDSQDAFDAGISAMVLYRHVADLAALRQSTDPVTLLEGDVWRPPKIEP